MRHLLIPAALVFLAAPVWAQPSDPSQIVGKGGFGRYMQQQAQQAQQQPQQQAAPQPAQQQQQSRPDRGGDRRGQYDGNRNDNRDNRGYDNRRSDNRGYNGPRRDYRGFRDYRRSYNSARRFRGPVYRRPYGWYDHRWSFGEFLPGLFWSSSYWLNDFDRYDLPPPPYGTVWVRNGDDALLVDRDNGEIISIRYGVFY